MSIELAGKLRCGGGGEFKSDSQLGWRADYGRNRSEVGKSACLFFFIIDHFSFSPQKKCKFKFTSYFKIKNVVY